MLILFRCPYTDTKLKPCSEICKLIKYFVIFPRKESHFIYFLTKMIYWAKLEEKLFLESKCTGLGFAENKSVIYFIRRQHQNSVFIKIYLHDSKHFIIVQIALDCR